MAFLDNSGDIILDAVLTDTGRFRLAKGDGSFKIVKFALSDDEINYRLYDKNNPSGSAYYDLEILQTPILEAFTNNTSTMNYKLLSIPRTNLLYLPVMKINYHNIQNTVNAINGGYAVAVTDGTMTAANIFTGDPGILNGETPTDTTNLIRVDQGLDTDAIGWKSRIDQDLRETQFIIEMDSRLGSLVSPGANVTDAPASFIDDDNIASYYVSSDSNTTQFVMQIYGAPNLGWDQASNTWPATALVIAGPTGPALRFKIRSSLELITSNYLFDMLGGVLPGAVAATWGFNAAHSYLYIDTVIKVTGATTGYKLDLPVRYIKCTNCSEG